MTSKAMQLIQVDPNVAGDLHAGSTKTEQGAERGVGAAYQGPFPSQPRSCLHLPAQAFSPHMISFSSALSQAPAVKLLHVANLLPCCRIVLATSSAALLGVTDVGLASSRLDVPDLTTFVVLTGTYA